MIEFNLDTKIVDLKGDLGHRTVNCLINENITDVRTLLSYTKAELLRSPNFGSISAKRLVTYLYERGYALGTMEKPKPKVAPEEGKGLCWFWANKQKPSTSTKVIFWTAHDQCFIGIFNPHLGWLTPLPRNTTQDWDTLIRVTANVTRWAYLPQPDDGNFY
jgi:hypothetical protein